MTNTGFFSDSESDSESSVVSERAYDVAKTLYRGLALKRKVFRQHHMPSWAKALQAVLDHFEKDEVIKVIEWYVAHIDDDFMPQAYSAKTFVDKFAAIYRAYSKADLANPEASVEQRLEQKLSEQQVRQQSLRDRLRSEGRLA